MLRLNCILWIIRKERRVCVLFLMKPVLCVQLIYVNGLFFEFHHFLCFSN